MKKLFILWFFTLSSHCIYGNNGAYHKTQFFEPNNYPTVLVQPAPRPLTFIEKTRILSVNMQKKLEDLIIEMKKCKELEAAALFVSDSSMSQEQKSKFATSLELVMARRKLIEQEIQKAEKFLFHLCVIEQAINTDHTAFKKGTRFVTPFYNDMFHEKKKILISEQAVNMFSRSFKLK